MRDTLFLHRQTKNKYIFLILPIDSVFIEFKFVSVLCYAFESQLIGS